MNMRITGRTAALAMVGSAMVAMLPMQAQAQQHGQTIADRSANCSGGSPSVRVNIIGVESGTGTMRVQLYRGTKSDWLQSGRWLNRIEVPARAGSMSVCMPVPTAGTYAIAVRHDTNGNGKTDLTQDGGAMSNNPSINIWNLGKPSYTKTAFPVGNSVKTITIRMRYA